MPRFCRLHQSQPPKLSRRQASSAQTDQKADADPARHDHRQTRFLWRRKARGHARRRTSPAQRPQQSGRKFSPTDPTTRADHEALQIRATRSAISFSPWPDQHSLSSPPKTSAQNHRFRRNLAFQVWAYVSGNPISRGPGARSASTGRISYYTGDLARKIVAASDAGGGYLKCPISPANTPNGPIQFGDIARPPNASRDLGDTVCCARVAGVSNRAALCRRSTHRRHSISRLGPPRALMTICSRCAFPLANF